MCKRNQPTCAALLGCGGQKMLSPFFFSCWIGIIRHSVLCLSFNPEIPNQFSPLTTFQKSHLVASYTTSSIYTCICACSVTSVMSNSLWPYGLHSARFLCPWHSPDKTSGVSCHALLQGIFPTQGMNLGFLYCRWILTTEPLPLSGKPVIVFSCT